MLHKPGEYVRSASFPIVFVNSEAFDEKVSEADAETYVAQAMRDMGFITAYTKDQLASGEVAPTAIGRMYANSYSPYGGWWVMGLAASVLRFRRRTSPTTASPTATISTYRWPSTARRSSPGVYRDQVEPIDLAPTLAVLLGNQ